MRDRQPDHVAGCQLIRRQPWTDGPLDPQPLPVTAELQVVVAQQAPGSIPASHRIWKPLHEPMTGPPASAKAPTAAITGEKRAIAPVRR